MITQKASNNRFICSFCHTTIKKDSNFFRELRQGYRCSLSVNICERCIAKMFIEIGINNKQISEIKKEMICEKLEEN